MLVALFAASAPMAQEFHLEEVGSIAAIAPDKLKPKTIYFSDYRNDQLTDAKSGLIRFADWAKAKPLQKQLLVAHVTATVPGISTSTWVESTTQSTLVAGTVSS